MAQATRLPLGSNTVLSGPVPTAPLTDDDRLHDALKYCSPSTYAAACQFRQTGQPGDLHAVMNGVIERYVEPALRRRLASQGDELRLIEDLGLDSLTLMEIVLRLEDALPISIRDEELRQLRTLGEVRRLIEGQTTSLASAALPSS